jgi:hypothetical protein
VIGEFGFHLWRETERLMSAAEAVPGHEYGDGRFQVN